jgi:hypothetical protein
MNYQELIIHARLTFPEDECHSEIPKSILPCFDMSLSGFEKDIDIESLRVLEELY